jgi:hypothetical protein
MTHTVEEYRSWIQAYLNDYVSTPIANGEIESYTVFDTQEDHYQVMNVGWDGHRRVHGCVLHLDYSRWQDLGATEYNRTASRS